MTRRAKNQLGLTRREMLGATASAICAPSVLAKTASVSFGLTPVFLDSDIKLISQIESYLSAQLGLPVTLVKRRTYMEITSLLLAGQLDAAWICGLPFVQHRSQLQLVAVPLYLGQPTYRAYVICHMSDEISDPIETRGRVHAFSDPDSNSGHLVTAAWLESLKETPSSFFSKFFFTYGHRNVIRAVASGLAHSGSVDGYVWDVMREVEPELISKSKVIRRSESMGFPPIASSRSTDPGISKAIGNALINMPNDPLGQKILATLRLDGFLSERPELFDSIAAAWQRVRRDG